MKAPEPDTHYERAPLIVYGWVVVESNFGKEEHPYERGQVYRV